MIRDIRFKVEMLLVDVVVLNLVFLLAYVVRFNSFYMYMEKFPFAQIFVTGVYIITLFFNRLFDKKKRHFVDLFFKIIQAVTIASFVIAIIAYFDWTFRLPRTIIVLIWFFSIVLLTAGHYLLQPRKIKKETAIVIGAKKGIVQTLSQFNIVGVIDDNVNGLVDNKSVVGKMRDVRAIIKRYDVETIVFALPEKENKKILDIILSCSDLDITFKAVSSLDEYVLSNGHSDNLINIVIKPANTLYSLTKRVLDISCSFFLIILFAPLMVLITLFVTLDSKGPILYRQERLGRFGKKFLMLKFRTMVINAEKKTGPIIITHKTNDKRVTRAGKILRSTHLDELPQVFNILFGEMSFVGPRPEREVFSEELSRQIRQWNKRLYIRPGLTGLAQVGDVGSLEPENKIKNDLFYIKNMSLILDLKIIIATAIKILRNIQW